MLKRTARQIDKRSRYCRDYELPLYTGLGANKSRELAILAGAKRKIGNAVIYDLEAIDDYIATLK